MYNDNFFVRSKLEKIMNNPIKKTLLLLIAISSFIAMSNTLCYAESVSGKWEVLVEGEPLWIAGTLNSAKLYRSVDDAGDTYYTTGEGLWNLNTPDGTPIAQGSTSIKLKYTSGKGGGSGSTWNNNKSKPKISSDGRFDLSGRRIYSATNQNNVVVDKDMLSNGRYILRSKSKEGKEESTNFIFINGEFIIQK